MNYKIKICSNENLSQRSFISITIQGKRYKEYTGKKIDLEIEPNRSSNLKEKTQHLKLLEFEFRKAIEDGRYLPHLNPDPGRQSVIFKTAEILQNALNQKMSTNVNKLYQRNLKYIYRDFIEFLKPEERETDIRNLKSSRIQEFLSRYNSSGTYYMNKRRDLGVLFSQVSKQLEQKLLIVKSTDKLKSKAKLHKIYDKKQIMNILSYLKENHENLYLCCLLSYGTFLRPHREVRNLRLHHFKNNINEIHLAGTENKSGRIRIVPIPEYVREALLPRLDRLEHNDNIFSLTETPFNEAYFNTSWTRQWRKMYKIGLIEENQTIYSFRHTAAVHVYRKTKDVHVVQQLLGHSDMIVTLNYLRGLGELNLEEHRQYMPEL